jgi:hypothetical protein
MGVNRLTVAENEEEKLVAELELLGIRYLSRQTAYRPNAVRQPDKLLADLVRQPSARVRAAVIAVLLTHPEFAANITTALLTLSPAQRITLQFYYLAAVLLQRVFTDQLQSHLGTRWQWIPERFTEEFALSSDSSPRETLIRLGREHQRLTNQIANWSGTCEDVARRLFHQWELEQRWNQ